MALGLALAGRADAYVGFAQSATGDRRGADLAAAERDYAESVEIYAALRRAGSIEGSVLEPPDTNSRPLGGGPRGSPGPPKFGVPPAPSLLCSPLAPPPPSLHRAPPSHVFHHGKIATVDPQFRIVEAMAIRDGRVLAAGTNAEMLELAGPAPSRSISAARPCCRA